MERTAIKIFGAVCVVGSFWAVAPSVIPWWGNMAIGATAWMISTIWEKAIYVA